MCYRLIKLAILPAEFTKNISMRTKTPLLFLAMLLLLPPALAEESPKTPSDVKSGWNFGLLPAVSFNSDLGFQYGGLLNLFHYGDGSRFPSYDHMFYFEISQHTKGTGLWRFSYDSEYFLPGLRFTFDLTYLPEQAIDFYGFNGYEALYNADWETDKSRMFYRMERNMVRAHLDLSGPLALKNIRWAAGLEFYDIRPNKVDVDKLNKGLSDEDKIPSHQEEPGLYELYQDWGLISEKEAEGGRFFGLKAGLVYDTRDFHPNPMKGIWTDVIVYAAPKPLSDLEQGFMRLNLTHRQYFTLVPEKLSFVYRLSYQSNLGTQLPFYALPLMITTQLRGAFSEGLGGQRSIRGVMRNRVIGNDFAYGNAEFRWKFVQFRLFNQHFYLGLNAFIDAGRILVPVDIETKAKAIDDPDFVLEDYFDFGAETFHWSSGLGLKVVMNQNFIISGDYGRTFNDQDGISGIYIGLNYLF